MMSRLRRVFFGALRFSGVPSVLRHTVQRSRLTILMFHDPAPDMMDGYLAALTRRYRVLSLREGVDACLNGRGALPNRALAITLDDGFRRNRELLPIFRKHGVRPTLFMGSGLVGTRRRFWFTVPMGRAVKERLKEVPDEARLAELAQMGFSETEEAAEAQVLSVEEVVEMARDLDFGSHTITHPVLPRCDEAKAWREISTSRQDLERACGMPFRTFAYPNGDCSDRDVDLVRRAGYEIAVTTAPGFAGSGTDPLRLPRIGMNDEGSVSEAIVTASGLWAALRPLFQCVASVARKA